MAVTPPMAVVETEEFLNRSKAILTETKRSLLVAHLGTNPEAGQLVPGTGGVRKIGCATPGQGERGGARVIYATTINRCHCSRWTSTRRTKTRTSRRPTN